MEEKSKLIRISDVILVLQKYKDCSLTYHTIRKITEDLNKVA